MSRLQLALNVNDEAVTFYSKLFGAEPAPVPPAEARKAAGQVRWLRQG